MNCASPRLPALCLTLWLVVGLALPVLSAAGRAQKSPPQELPAEKLRGVLSRQRLIPVLRTKKMIVKFSPNGQWLLLQSDSGMFLYSTSPLNFKTYITAENMYEVRFSPDSQTLVGVSLALRTGRWRLVDGQLLETKNLVIPRGCIAGRVSPDAETFACYRPDGKLSVYELKTGKELMEEHSEGAVDLLESARIVPLSVVTNNLLAPPLGFVGMRDLSVFANRNLFSLPMTLSPHGETLLVSEPQGPVWFNLTTCRKMSIPGALKKRIKSNIVLLDADRLLTFSKTEPPQISSLSSGEVVAKPEFEASDAQLASNSRYLILSSKDSSSRRLFNLETFHSEEIAENAGVDVTENLLAVYSERGEIFLYRLGEERPIANAKLPLDGAPAALSVLASPDLDVLALDLGGAAGIYRISTGQRLASLETFSAGTLQDSSTGFFVRPLSGSNQREVVEVDAKSGEETSRWQSTPDQLILQSSENAFFEYGFESPPGAGPTLLLNGVVAYKWTARDVETGNILWKREFPGAEAVPFVDPQGHSIVFGWQADSEQGKRAAKRCPQVWDSFRKAKISARDTFFEVLDAYNGKTLGGVLVQMGAGAINFDSVFSVGSSLLVWKEEGRLSLYSLGDGQLKSHLIGSLPAASGASQLLALAENSRRVGIYDLASGEKIEEQQFSEPIAYMHFSADGKRLLVLTRWQLAYVLDLAELRKPGKGEPVMANVGRGIIVPPRE